MDRAKKIADLNDAFRVAAIGAAVGQVPVNQVPGRFVATREFAALPKDTQRAVLEKVRDAGEAFADATNDPYGEHDSGTIEHAGETFFWKIDYYDADLKYGSEDPADPDQTTRVMTVMLASDY